VFNVDSFGGARPITPAMLAPNLSDTNTARLSFVSFDVGEYSIGPPARNSTAQLNFADDVAVTHAGHQFKVGIDYRTLLLNLRPSPVVVLYEALSISSLLSSGQAFVVQGARDRSAYLRSSSTAIYGQDTWKVTPRLTLTYGLRWELSPAPSARRGTTLTAWQNTNDPANLALAPLGTPLWRTRYTDFAPRLGVAYRLTDRGDLVLRAGGGIFYDLASDTAGNLGSDFPNIVSKISASVALPISDITQFLPGGFSTQPPFTGLVQGFAPDLRLPRSYQWNIAVDKSFAREQAVSVTYVGQAGRDLLRQEGLTQPNATFSAGTAFLLTQNSARSNYNALQVQYRKPFASRLQALLSYSWAHSLDNASNDGIAALSSAVLSAAKDYASSDFDVRHSFSGALTYSVPAAVQSGFWGQITKGWSMEPVIVARSGLPFNGVVLTARIAGVNPRPNLVSGQPLWMSNATAPGGKSLNAAAFATPPAGQQGTEGRNDISGFGLTQVDLSIGRIFAITDHVKLQFRTDAFNLFNHPNFANPAGDVGLGPSFLQSSRMLNQGLGGLNSLFQEGGPRSLQLSLRLNF
jgi:hypothetical protein